MGRFLLVFTAFKDEGQILWGVDGDGRLVGQADRTLEFLGDKAGVDTDVVRAVRFAESDLVIHQFQFHLYPIGERGPPSGSPGGRTVHSGPLPGCPPSPPPSCPLDGGWVWRYQRTLATKAKRPGQRSGRLFDKCTLGHTIPPQTDEIGTIIPAWGKCKAWGWHRAGEGGDFSPLWAKCVSAVQRKGELA